MAPNPLSPVLSAPQKPEWLFQCFNMTVCCLLLDTSGRSPIFQCMLYIFLNNPVIRWECLRWDIVCGQGPDHSCQRVNALKCGMRNWAEGSRSSWPKLPLERRTTLTMGCRTVRLGTQCLPLWAELWIWRSDRPWPAEMLNFVFYFFYVFCHPIINPIPKIVQVGLRSRIKFNQRNCSTKIYLYSTEPVPTS